MKMKKKMSRREFVMTGAAVGLSVAAPRVVSGRAPAVQTGQRISPLVIASANGHGPRNGGPMTCVEKAFEMITHGEDVLDAVVEGVTIVELDPEAGGVGYGGAPNADGVVQLDACCLHGPKKQAGGVGALEGVKTAAQVAKAVSQHTDHHLLVGQGAQTFARNLGFTVEDDLNTDETREQWLEWKRRTDPAHYLDPDRRAALGLEVGLRMMAEGRIAEDDFWGTINCNAISANGEICGVTTTSGLAWKIPGRVGDSPILGAGLYVDGAVGTVGSTGRGEANLYNLTSYLIVENLRRGLHPKDAGMEGLKRVQENTVEERLLNGRGLPAFGITFYVMNANGEHAGVSMYASERSRYAMCTENGPNRSSSSRCSTARRATDWTRSWRWGASPRNAMALSG